MKGLFDLSHFFEFLCGVYFGGGALLGFIEESLISRIKTPVEKKVIDVQRIRSSAADFTNIFINKQVKDLKTIDFVALLASNFFKLGDFVFYKSLNAVSSFIKKLDAGNKDKRSNILLKRYFPIFFYTGFYCLMMVLFSALQLDNQNTKWSNRIDWFFINFSFGSFLFQLCGLFIIPRWVGKKNYIRVLAIGIFIALCIIVGTMVFASLSYIIVNGDLLLAKQHKSLCQSIVVFISIFPLIFLMLLSVWVLLRWELITLFYSTAFYLFDSRVSNTIDTEIEQIKN